MCWLSLAWKPLARLGFSWPRPSKTKAWAKVVGLGQLRLSLGLGRGLWEKNHVMSHPSNATTRHRDWQRLQWPLATIATHDEWWVTSSRAQDMSFDKSWAIGMCFDFFTNYIILLPLGKDDVTNILDDCRTSLQQYTGQVMSSGAQEGPGHVIWCVLSHWYVYIDFFH